MKSLGLTASLTDALQQRGVADLTARVAAERGALTLKTTYERWSDTANSEEFGEVARRTLSEVQAAGASC